MISINGNDSDLKHDLNFKQREAQLHKMRHSCAHIMAQSVMERFSSDGRVELGAGPAIANGFYYDFNLPRPLQDDDLEWIENRMKQIAKGKHEFKQSFASPDEARELFKHQPFKLELIDLIASGLADDNAEELSSREKKPNSEAPNSVSKALSSVAEREIELSIFRHDSFVDLCKGPHVQSSIEIDPDALKVLHTAGSYWRGSEHNPMLTRIYGTVFSSKQELDEHLHLLEEIKRRDHRRIGKRLELFHFDETAPGMPYWLPNGMRVLNELFAFWRNVHEKNGYEEISSPILNNKKLWEISGHWEHYQDNMFLVKLDDDNVYGLKPMNCPNAMIVFGLKLRSYRDLPMRLSDCDVLHRHERSGTLSGLFRVQKFQQDDAHIFVSHDQIEDEFDKILDLAHQFYSVFDLSYSFRLSLRPDKFVGDVETWDRAESSLKKILDRRVGEDNYAIAEKDGAFYGPKIDILMQDSLGRKWQMGTIQLDFQQPERFGLKYIDSDGKQKTPAVIHRVIYGSVDRFLGVLLEHTNGELPLWIAPLQVVLVPITDRHNDYAKSIAERLREEGIRCKVDDGTGRMTQKIREWELQKVPCIAVVGDKEQANQSLSPRLRGGEQQSSCSIDSFVERIKVGILEKRSEV